MRILFCNYEYPPLGGGGGVVMAALARELAKRHQVTALTSRAGGLPPITIDAGVRVVRVPVLFRRQLDTANFPSMLAYLPAAAWGSRSLRLERGCDVVNTHFVVPTGPVGQWIADRYRLPNVLSVHGGDLYDPSKRMSPHNHGWLRRPIRTLLQRADAVVAQSTNTRDNVRKIFGVEREVSLIPLGIDRPPPMERVPPMAFGLPADAFTIVTIGRLVARKQTTQLVAAVAGSGIANAHLLVVGAGPDQEPIRRAAAAHGVADRVHLLGRLDNAGKYRALAAADVFASTSQHEGFGLVFLEAMAYGLPILCYDHGGQTDYLESGVTGYVLRLNDAPAFARSIRAIAELPDRGRSIGAYNARRVEEFFIDRCAVRYEAVFERVIVEHRNRAA
ncbi:MAG: glycosyltransferase family 4 protein [Steroidobacteraceae bacterium]